MLLFPYNSRGSSGESDWIFLYKSTEHHPVERFDMCFFDMFGKLTNAAFLSGDALT